MMEYSEFCTMVKSAAGVAAGVLILALGGADAWLGALLTVIVIDYITGVLGACAAGRLNSRVGFAGIGKKLAILCIVALAARLDLLLGASGALRSMAMGFYLANDALSILENAVEMGVPVPKALVERLEQMKEGEAENDREGSIS